MNKQIKLMFLISTIALTLPACNLLKKAASGGKISQGDLVNAADQENKTRERNNEKVVRLEKKVSEDLASIEESRKTGRFSSAKYRTKSLNKNLADLRTLDGDNAKLKTAPKKLAELESTYTPEVYNKKVLVKKCSEMAEGAKAARMDENWRKVNYLLVDYTKCRRKLKDVGIDDATIAESDKIATPEYEKLMAGLVTAATTYRKEKKFRNAVALETNIENHVRYYEEINPEGTTGKSTLKKIASIRKKYRDPEEVKVEQAKGAFASWRKNVIAMFDKEWTNIETAEKAARPLFEEGQKLAETDAKKAEQKLLQARQKLYTEAYPSSLAMDAALKNNLLQKGLSYEISSALAKIYFEQGEKAKLYPELSIIKTGRPWMSKEKEIQVRLYNILADYKGKLSPKPTDFVRRYAARYSTTTKEYKLVADEANATAGQTYNMLGVQEELVSYRSAGSNPAENVGKIVKMEKTVDAVSGGKLRFDFRGSYKKPVKCWRTKNVAGVNYITGRVIYEQRCKYKTVKTGYYIVVPKPAKYKLAKGDRVEFYATVGKKKGNDVNFVNPTYVVVAPKGQVKYFMGVHVKK